MIVALSNQNSQPSFRVKPRHSAATPMGDCQNKNTNKKANCCGNQNWKTTKMLTKKTNKEDLGDVMMKLEGKRFMCLKFCIRAAVLTTRHEPFRNPLKVY